MHQKVKRRANERSVEIPFKNKNLGNTLFVGLDELVIVSDESIIQVK